MIKPDIRIHDVCTICIQGTESLLHGTIRSYNSARFVSHWHRSDFEIHFTSKYGLIVRLEVFWVLIGHTSQFHSTFDYLLWSLVHVEDDEDLGLYLVYIFLPKHRVCVVPWPFR